jgi:hypothetical protein
MTQPAIVASVRGREGQDRDDHEPLLTRAVVDKFLSTWLERTSPEVPGAQISPIVAAHIAPLAAQAPSSARPPVAAA